MKVLIDTNVVIDVINKREPFFEDSYRALQLAFQRYRPCVSVTTITDTVYVTRKTFSDVSQQKAELSRFFADFKICTVGRRQIRQSFASPMADFEDAVQAFCAKRAGIRLIITRNTKDYALSPVQAVTPTEFMNIQYK